MRLLDLEPQFIRYEIRIEPYQVVDGDPTTWRERGCPTKVMIGPKEHLVFVATLQEAQGIFFLCPKCFQANGGRVGTHGLHVTFDGRDVPPGVGGHNSRGEDVVWQVSGTSIWDLTLSPSIWIEGGCGWHGFVEHGMVRAV